MVESHRERSGPSGAAASWDASGGTGPDGIERRARQRGTNELPDFPIPGDHDPSSAGGSSTSSVPGESPRNTSAATTVPDEVLTRRAALGDKVAFAHLTRRHGPALYRYVFRLLNDTSDAQDCVQEVMVSAWKNITSFRGDSAFRTWLFVLGRNAAQKLSQRRRPRFPESGSRPVIDFDQATAGLRDLHADPARDTIDSQLLAALDAALLLLPERQRSVWILREIEDLSYADIATVVSVSPTAVRGLLQRARTAIAATLEEWR